MGGVLKGARDVGGGGARWRRRRRRPGPRLQVEPHGSPPHSVGRHPAGPPPPSPLQLSGARPVLWALARRGAGVRRRGGGASPRWVGGGARERAGETMAGSGAGGGGGETKVIYHLDEEETPYLVKIPVPAERITLGDFKSVLQRPAGAKYFFKSMDQDFG